MTRFTDHDERILNEIQRCGFVNIIEGEGGTETGMRITRYRLDRLIALQRIEPSKDKLFDDAASQTYIPATLFHVKQRRHHD